MVTDDKELADIVRKMTMYGISDSREIWNSRYTKKGHWLYDIEMIGYKANMSDLNAAIGIQQLAKLNYFIEVRQKYSEIYLNKLRGLGYDFMETKEGNKNSWHLFPLLLPKNINRDNFTEILKEHGIGTSVLFRPLHLHSAYAALSGTKEGDFPVSESIFNRLVNLPLSPATSEEEIEYIIKIIKEY